MSEQVKKTKQGVCIDCGIEMTVSLYASLKTCRCATCKRKKPRKVKEKATRHTSNITMSKPVAVELIRNRQETEALIIMDTGEFHERIPCKFKSKKNEIDYLSGSKIDTYERCPSKFHRQYMTDEGVENDGSNMFTWFGSILHEVVEYADKYYHDTGIISDPIALYDDAWRKRPMLAIEQYIEGKGLIQDYFARYPIGTRTNKFLGVEVEWRGEFAGTTFGLMIDKLEALDHETGLMIDYKTNRMPFTPLELSNSVQLGIYEVILRKHIYPEYKKWITGYELFRFGWQQCPERTEEDLENIERYVANVAHQILHDNTWEEKLNEYCGYCQFSGSCKRYQDFITHPDKYIEEIVTESTNIDELSKSKDTLATYEKIAKGRKDKVNTMLRVAVEEGIKTGQKITADGKELQLYAQPRKSYKYHEIKQLMASTGNMDLLDKCLSITKTKLDKEIKDPQLKMQLENCIVTSYTTPYVVKSKIKK